VSQEAPQWSAGAGVSAKGARSYLHRAGPGKNSGLVVFDRWGGSILYSGIYVMYVSESTKKSFASISASPSDRCQESLATDESGRGLITDLAFLRAPNRTVGM
jgi:hypothetical protein